MNGINNLISWYSTNNIDSIVDEGEKMDLVEELEIKFYGIAIDGNRGWFAGADINGLFEMNLVTGKVQLENWFPNEETYLTNQYRTVIKIDEDLWIIPKNANKIWKYNLVSKIFKQIDYKPINCVKVFNQFTDYCLYKEYIFLVPGRYQSIVCINTKTDEIEYIEDWYDEINALTFDKDSVFFNSCICKGKHMLMAFWQGSYICDLDMETKKTKLYKLDCAQEELSDIALCGNEYMVACKKTCRLLICDQEFNIIDKVDLMSESGKQELGYMYILAGVNRILLVPFFGKYILVLDNERNIVNRINLVEQGTKKPTNAIIPNCNMLITNQKNEQIIYGYNVYEKELWKIQLSEQGESEVPITKILCELPSEWSKQEIFDYRYPKVATESNYYDLSNLLKRVIYNKQAEEYRHNATIGSMIHNKIKGYLKA